MIIWAMAAQPALACGGFFCEPQQPVLQAAERIVFGIDEAGGTVEMHVQIAYDGPSDDFAWIVPVPDDPELFLTTSSLFTQLAIQTLPVFSLQREVEGTCRSRNRDRSSDASSVADTGIQFGPPSSSSDGGVVVLREETIGPYETVVLQADSPEDLLTWLQGNGYDLPDGLSSVLAPYVQGGATFVALKLAKDRDAGDLAPLALRYRATQASIPVQLTAVAATPDMRMEAYVLADARAVPESYLHVRINEAAIDWWNQGSNYPNVITRAADEAGGHAFATDFAGSTDRWASAFDRGDYDRNALRRASGPVGWMTLLVGMLAQVPPELDAVVDNHVPLPDGVTARQFISCPDCWGTLTGSFDARAATEDAELFVVEPLQRAQALIDEHPRLSRMTSSLSPVEMTVDPVFAVNRQMPTEVSEVHQATLVYECSGRIYLEDALRRLVLADGRELVLPSESWFAEHGTTELAYLQEHGADAAIVIERTGATGQPEPVSDQSERLRALADAHNQRVRQLFAGCAGCASSGGAGGSLALFAILGLAAARRRQR